MTDLEAILHDDRLVERQNEEMRNLLRQRPLKVRLQHAVRDINTTVLVENDIDVQKLRKIKFRPRDQPDLRKILHSWLEVAHHSEL